MASREQRPLTLPVTPGQPRLAWHAREPVAGAAPRPAVVQERVGQGPASGRLLLAPDNLEALQGLLAEGLGGAVDLIYIDPPFMAGSDRGAYRDTWPGGLDGYLDMLRARLLALRPLLAATGNLFVHLDWHAVHYAKVLLDEIFGLTNFRNEIVWRRANAHSDPARFGVITDAILFYGASARAYWADVHVPHAPAYVASHWRRADAGGRYRLIPLDAPRHGDGGQLVYPWHGKRPAPSRTWALQREAMEALERDGRIIYTAAGTPNLKRYLAESPGLRAQNLWDDIPPVNPMATERLGYPTQKPVALLERIIAAACPPDGLVLDAFLGSGTTAEAAQRLGRRWIGIDSNPAAIQLARRRLLAMAGTPARGPVRASYSECEQCRQMILRASSPRLAAIGLRAFTIEAIDPIDPIKTHAIPELAVAGSAAGEGSRVEIVVLGRSVTIHLRGALAAVATWSVDWEFVPPVIAATTHHVLPRRGALTDVAEHGYDAAGPRRIAVQVVDTAGIVTRSVTSLDLP